MAGLDNDDDDNNNNGINVLSKYYVSVKVF